MLITSVEAARLLGENFLQFVKYNAAAGRDGATVLYDSADVERYRQKVEREGPRWVPPARQLHDATIDDDEVPRGYLGGRPRA